MVDYNNEDYLVRYKISMHGMEQIITEFVPRWKLKTWFEHKADNILWVCAISPGLNIENLKKELLS